MPLYFLLLDASVFHDRLKPALTACWRQRSFVPCRDLCGQLQGHVTDFAQRYHLGAQPTLLAAVATTGLPFDRVLWQHLAGELLWFSAAEIPDIATNPEALSCLLNDSRAKQILYGSRDLLFGGGFYRPDQAGWNDSPDVALLADYLAHCDPASWSTAALASVPGLADEADRAEELEFVRDWFSPLVELYGKAKAQGQVVVCEVLK